jgi:hypothetical protein
MLFKRIINIALIIVLLLAVIGISSSKTYCQSMQEVVSGDCCKDISEEEKADCCLHLDFYQHLEADLSIVDGSVSVPDALFFTLAFIQNFLIPEAILNEHHNYVTYRSPLITSDIPVLHRVFRI